jgi:hypothetical protein
MFSRTGLLLRSGTPSPSSSGGVFKSIAMERVTSRLSLVPQGEN